MTLNTTKFAKVQPVWQSQAAQSADSVQPAVQHLPQIGASADPIEQPSLLICTRQGKAQRNKANLAEVKPVLQSQAAQTAGSAQPVV